MNEAAIAAIKDSYANAIDNAYRYSVAFGGKDGVPSGLMRTIESLRSALREAGVPELKLYDRYDPTRWA